MKTMLRNLARRWADKAMIEIADDWQMRCIRAQARADRLRRRVTHLEQAAVAHSGIVELARQWRSYYHAPDPDPEVWARLESALGRAIDALPTAPARGFDEHCADAAGVAGPETREAKHQCPEGLMFNGDVATLIRCERRGGHDGNHRGGGREWPHLPQITNCEVPW